MDNSYHADDLRVSDEEILPTEKEGKKLLLYITRRSQSRIIMVTHKIS